jgi:hypothetical protein
VVVDVICGEMGVPDDYGPAQQTNLHVQRSHHDYQIRTWMNDWASCFPMNNGDLQQRMLFPTHPVAKVK